MLQSLEREKERLPSQIIVIFGATGDLMKRKLISAFYRLMHEKMMPKNFAIVGFSRRPVSDKEYQKILYDSLNEFNKRLKINQRVWERLSSRIYYHQGNFNDADSFKRLRRFLRKLHKKHRTKGNMTFYFATGSSNFTGIVGKMIKNRVVVGNRAEKDHFERLIFEKPFGDDLNTAQRINDGLLRAFEEKDIFRIDHYMGKETVQNIMVLRFANALFEPLWNHKYIDHVQIIADEILGVGSRGGYYDGYGALKDMFQNHLMQLLMFTAMEPPAVLDSSAIMDEKIKVLQSIKQESLSTLKNNVVKAQYTKGFANGKMRKGYTEVKGVNPDSKTETFIAAKLEISNWRWAGVPFYLRTGKRLGKKQTKIVIHFKEAPRILFHEKQVGISPNVLKIRLQPNEGIALHFNAKKPGKGMEVTEVKMDFCHACILKPNTPEAYQVLIYDAMKGDHTLFTSWTEVEYAWKISDNISKIFKKQKKMPKYKAGSDGPKEADLLIERDGRSWNLR